MALKAHHQGVGADELYSVLRVNPGPNASLYFITQSGYCTTPNDRCVRLYHASVEDLVNRLSAWLSANKTPPPVSSVEGSL